MLSEKKDQSGSRKKIVVQRDGPYLVVGEIPLVEKEQIVSEYGEPLTWKKGKTIPTQTPYELCRCGHSKEFPFCDYSHLEIDFDGTESADSQPTAARQKVLPGGTGIVVKQDESLCMNSGFCGTRDKDINAIVRLSANTEMRSLLMAMIERCPSGSLVYAMSEGKPEIEPDLPEEIAVTVEITSAGPIRGPLWVTGGIPVERADGKPLDVRNRVTLCNCGHSCNKPLCDGAHRENPVETPPIEEQI